MAISELDLRRFLVDRVARACDLSPDDLDPDRLLEQYGIASRDAVAATGELEEVLGRRLEPTSVWRYPTINQLVRGLLSSAEPDGVAITPPGVLSGSEIAVIGLAQRLLESAANGLTLRQVIWEALEHAGTPPRDLTGTSLSEAMADLRAGAVELAVAVLDGPGCRVVVLKRLADAGRDLDQVLALCTDPEGNPTADFFEAVQTADRGLTPDLIPFPVGSTISCPEAVIHRARPAAPTPSTGPTRLLLSDTSLDGIRTYAGQLAEHLRTDSGSSTADVAHTLARRLGRGPLRATVTGRERADLTAALTSLAQGTPHPGNFAGKASTTPPQPLWVFPSQPLREPTPARPGSASAQPGQPGSASAQPGQPGSASAQPGGSASARPRGPASVPPGAAAGGRLMAGAGPEVSAAGPGAAAAGGGLVAGAGALVGGAGALVGGAGALVGGAGALVGSHLREADGVQPAGLRELAESVPGFVEVIAELDPLMVWATGVSLRDAVLTDVVAAGDELVVGFAVQVGLALAWRGRGVVPGAIVAEGSGEIAAAVVAGALTATEGARVIGALARTPDQLGPMLADLAPAEVRLPFYSTTSTDAAPFGAEYWIAGTKPSTSVEVLLDRAADDGHQIYVELTADALAFHTQLAMLEVLGLPVIPPPGRVTDVPVAPWPGS
ncbi:acyltransferase domain-containing protein [Kribbella ginsengisoli]|uniref:Carrier domain-containing protein n=1 Tax=Kribbella ginsengisoli TaxID=363865 RepID=A0ABP6X0C9_9ACTN